MTTFNYEMKTDGIKIKGIDPIKELEFIIEMNNEMNGGNLLTIDDYCIVFMKFFKLNQRIEFSKMLDISLHLIETIKDVGTFIKDKGLLGKLDRDELYSLFIEKFFYIGFIGKKFNIETKPTFNQGSDKLIIDLLRGFSKETKNDKIGELVYNLINLIGYAKIKGFGRNGYSLNYDILEGIMN